MAHSGERFIPTDSSPIEVIINLNRYIYAVYKCQNKSVVDVGCGAGLGTYLYNLVATKTYAVDYDAEAISMAANNYHLEDVDFRVQDLETDHHLPIVDVIVALEFLEHLRKPEQFLADQNIKELVFSLPKDSLSISKWHKTDIKNEADVRNLLLMGGYKIQEIFEQEELWYYGYALKI